MTPTELENKPLALPGAAVPSMADSNLARTGFMPPLYGPSEGNPHQPPGLSSPPTLSSLLQALRRRWPLALALALVGTFVAVLAVFIVFPPRYAAAVILQVSARADSPVFGEGHQEETPHAVIKLNIAGLVKSTQVLQNALVQKTSTGKNIKDLAIVREHGGSVEWLEGRLKTDFQNGPDWLRITLSADRPDEAAELVNAVGRAVVEESAEKDKDRRERRIRQLKENQGKLEVELSKLRQQRNLREKEARVKDREVQLEKYRGALVSLSRVEDKVAGNLLEQTKAREELATLQLRLKKIDDIAISAEKVEDAFRKDPRSQGLLQELDKVEKEYIDTKSTGRAEFVGTILGNLNLKKQDIQKRIADLRQQLRPELESRWRDKIADDMLDRSIKLADTLATLEKLDPLLKAELQRARDEAKQLEPANQPLPLEIVHLRERITNMEASLAKITQTIEVMRADVLNPRVAISQLAAAPTDKDYSRQIKLAGGGGVFLFGLLLFGVAFMEFRSRKISGADDVAQGLGLNVVGSLPALPARSSKSAAQPPGQALALPGRAAEAIDGVRTMLLHAARTDNLRVLMVTSALPGEGKTTLAGQLAMSLARSWRKTLLIDGDLRHPGAHKLFELAAEPGFSEVLRNEANPADAIKPTALSRLWLLPAGQFDDHAAQALAQDSLRDLFEQLKQQYDFIIVDSSPVLPVADALLLGQNVDGVIFSILKDVSRVPAVHAAQQKLNNLGIRTVGAVMIGATGDAGNVDYHYA